MHFECVSEFLALCNKFFQMRFYFRTWCISMIFLSWEMPRLFWTFFLHVQLITLLFHMDNTSLFFLLIYFSKFQQENYANMQGHYGSKIGGVFLGPFSEALGLTISILWWHRPFFYGGSCPIYFFRELGFGGFIFVLQVSILYRLVLEEYISQVEGGPNLFQSCLHVV